MKHLKPIFTLVAALALLFTLCACGSSERKEPSTTALSTTESPKPTEQ